MPSCHACNPWECSDGCVTTTAKWAWKYNPHLRPDSDCHTPATSPTTETPVTISPWVQTTNRCNLRCSYCYVPKNQEDMADETYQKIGKWIEQRPEAEKVFVRLAGGEPFLVYENWRHHVKDYLLSDASCDIITNLTTVPRDFEKEFGGKVNLSVSLDGLFRSKPFASGLSSHKAVLDNIERLKEAFQIYILTTVTDQTEEELTGMCDYIACNNFNWRLCTDYFDAGIDKKEGLITGVMNYLRDSGYSFNRLNFNQIGSKGCTAGENIFAVGVDGGIYTCQTLLGKDDRRLGRMGEDDPVDLLAGGKHSHKKLLSKKCGKCDAYPLCHGWCPLNFKPSKKGCDAIKRMCGVYTENQ